jgi:predicted ATPase
MIIESHSEHLLLRLLRRIRETATADIPHTRFRIGPEDVAVLYFEPDGDETFVHNLQICPDGTFADRWPAGFFDERFEEIFGE